MTDAMDARTTFGENDSFGKGFASKNEGFANNTMESKPSDLEEQKKEQKRTKKKWSYTWYEFCQGTTLHGMKQLTEPQPFIIRRLLWLCLVLVGGVIFAYQMCTSILYYYSWPVTVNIKINYNESLRFPALTICNQNAFKMTTAAERGEYELLSQVYSSGEGSSIQWEKYNGSQVGLDELYLANAHLQHDLIVQCLWDGLDCHPDDVAQEITDFGVCYTFNGDLHQIKHAHRTGAEGGVSLLLNIQQYEYMPGPNSGAGIKLSLHKQQETVSVRDHGIAIPPGSHAFVPMKVIQIENLEPPLGKCDDSIELVHYNHYTKTACNAECWARFVKNKCGCRDIYMPEMDDTPVCTLKQNKECIQLALEMCHDKEENFCMKCPVSCHSVHYEPSVSYASLSNFDMLRLLRSNMTRQLNENYQIAHETTQRVTAKIVNRDNMMIRDLAQTAFSLHQTMHTMEERLNEIEDLVSNMMAKLSDRVEFHMYSGLDRVEFIARHDFVRGFGIRKERYLNYVAANFYEVTERFERMIKKINNSVPVEDVTRRQDLWMDVDDMLAGRKRLAEYAYFMIEDVNDAYISGDPLLRFLATIDRRYDMSYIAKELLTDKAVEQAEYVNASFVELKEFVESLNELQDLGKNFTQTAKLDKRHFRRVEKKFHSASKGCNYRIFQIEERIVLHPVVLIKDRISEFKDTNASFSYSLENWKVAVHNMKSLMVLYNEIHWSQMIEIINKSLYYLDDPTLLKAPLAEAITSKQMSENMQHVETSLRNIRSRAQDLYDAWTDLRKSYKHIWINMLTESTTKKFYEMIHKDYKDYLSSTKNETKYIRIFASMLKKSRKVTKGSYPNTDLEYKLNADFHTSSPKSKKSEINRQFVKMMADTDIRANINVQDEMFLTLFEQYKSALQEFLDEGKIDSKFYTDNFMRLDVYMQELSYEEVLQQADYDIIKLLGDIGGSLGLFMGASVMTVVEYMDLFVHFGMKRLLIHN